MGQFGKGMRFKPFSIDTPVGIIATFAFPIPKKEAKEGSIKEGDFRPKTPDLDNVEKFLMDSIKGLFWIDDRQVSLNIVQTIYSERPRTEFAVFKPTKLIRDTVWQQVQAIVDGVAFDVE